jgi:hypothetical protein
MTDHRAASFLPMSTNTSASFLAVANREPMLSLSTKARPAYMKFTSEHDTLRRQAKR